jgi:glycosyltransferase involved in cell wall biosynthesis
MTVLFGHPTGNPNSHQAALAHFEAGWLEAFCVPWMPSPAALERLERLPGLRTMARRLSRRDFAPLRDAPKIEGRFGEWRRLALRALGLGGERLAYEANDWLMATMARETGRKRVTAVHAYEDCSLLQFEKAKKLGKACIYDMPIGYYPAWQETQAQLAQKFADWLPEGGLPSQRHVRPEQKKAEMALADLVLAPSGFVEKSVRTFHPEKHVARAPYGVDADFWSPGPREAGPLTYIYAGQISLRKGIPDLLIAWERAQIPDARLLLVGSWHLSERKKREMPAGVVWSPPLSREELRAAYRGADVFVFPSYFEGFGLVLLEAMACGLPAIASDATAAPDMLSKEEGHIVPAGDNEALMEALRWCAANRDHLARKRVNARAKAEQCSWENYRRHVREAVEPFVLSHPIQYYAPLYQRLAKRGDLDVKIFFTWHSGEAAVQDRGFGLPVAWDVPLTSSYEYELVPNVASDPGTHRFTGLRNPALLERVLQWKPDVVHVTGWAWQSHLLLLRALHKRGIRTLFRGDSHLLDERQTGPRWWMKKNVLRQVFRWPSAFLVTGAANRAYYEAFGVPHEKLIACPHSIDVARFAGPAAAYEEEAQRWRKELDISADACVILFAGKFEPKKRPLELMKAVRELDEKNIVLVMVGSGELEPRVKAMAGERPGVFRILPFQNQSRMPVVYRLGDLVVLPSAYGETWGMAVNEALACGRPVLVSDHVGCAADVVTDACGRIFPTGDPDALKAALKDLTANRAALSSMRKSAAERATHFDFAETERTLMDAIGYIRSNA